MSVSMPNASRAATSVSGTLISEVGRTSASAITLSIVERILSAAARKCKPGRRAVKGASRARGGMTPLGSAWRVRGCLPHSPHPPNSRGFRRLPRFATPPPVHMHPVMPVPRELARPRRDKRQQRAGPAGQPAGRDQGSRLVLRRDPPRDRPQHRRRETRRVRKKHRRGGKIGLANIPVPEHTAPRLEHSARLGAPQRFAGTGMPRAINFDSDAPYARHRQRYLQHYFSNPRSQVNNDIIGTQPRGSDKLAHPGRGQLAIHARPGRPQLASIRTGAARAEPRNAVVEPLNRHGPPARPRRWAPWLRAIIGVAQSTLATATRSLIH